MATFREIIGRSKEQQDEARREVAVQEAVVQTMHAVQQAQARVLALTAAMEQAVSVPFDPVAYVNAQRDLADARQDLEDLKAAQRDLGLVPTV